MTVTGTGMLWAMLAVLAVLPLLKVRLDKQWILKGLRAYCHFIATLCHAMPLGFANDTIPQGFADRPQLPVC